MAKNETKRVKPAVLADDVAALNALRTITSYAPSNPNHSITAITQAINDMNAAQAAEDQAAAAVAAARDQAAAKEWAFHNLVLGVKDQVKAQYGKDSPEVQSLGLKRASEYKSRKPKGSDDPK